MALADLDDHLAEHGVDPALSSHLISSGWNSQNFSAVVDSKSGFTDEIWAEFSDQPIPLVQRANLKVAWQRLQPETVSAVRELSDGAAAPSAGVPQEGSWAESFAPKIQSSTVSKLKKQFLEDYPSEVLTMETMPSTRLLSLAYHQHSKQEYRWIPWKFRMTQSRMEDMVIYQRPKTPKIEGLQLHQLIWDEPPSLDINNQGSERNQKHAGGAQYSVSLGRGLSFATTSGLHIEIYGVPDTAPGLRFRTQATECPGIASG